MLPGWDLTGVAYVICGSSRNNREFHILNRYVKWRAMFVFPVLHRPRMRMSDEEFLPKEAFSISINITKASLRKCCVDGPTSRKKFTPNLVNRDKYQRNKNGQSDPGMLESESFAENETHDGTDEKVQDVAKMVNRSFQSFAIGSLGLFKTFCDEMEKI